MNKALCLDKKERDYNIKIADRKLYFRLETNSVIPNIKQFMFTVNLVKEI